MTHGRGLSGWDVTWGRWVGGGRRPRPWRERGGEKDSESWVSGAGGGVGNLRTPHICGPFAALLPLPGILFPHYLVILRSQPRPHPSLQSPLPAPHTSYALPCLISFHTSLRASYISFYFPCDLLWPLHKCIRIYSLVFH